MELTDEQRDQVDLLLRDHVLADDEQVVYDLFARMVAEAEQRGRADERGRIAADVAEFCSDDSSIEWVLHVIETGGTP